LNLSHTALEVLNRRYLKDGETPEDMFLRVANAVAEAEIYYMSDNCQDNRVELYREDFYRIMTDSDFLPNSPTLMNAGRELGQLSACFSLQMDDNTISIFDTVKYAALIHKSGGGTGISFSKLRPKNDTVQTTRGVSSGPVSFMTIFNTATEVIKQGGVRRGASIGLLSVDHPDILEFISCKQHSNNHNNFNLSVSVTDNFMNAVINNTNWDLINPKNMKIVKSIPAQEIFNIIAHQAWRHGDPGIIFFDEINRCNLTPHLGKLECVNPCAEQPLYSWESCNLGSINLSHFITKRLCFDGDRLAKVVRIAVRFLDNVITINKFPLKQIEEATLQTRKIGLGVMGWADALAMMNMPYDSQMAFDLARDVMGHIQYEAKKASRELAIERGTYPAITIQNHPIRNATVTTIAPTGSLSIIAGCSSGIEPYFALAYKRNILDGDSFYEINPIVEQKFSHHEKWDEIRKYVIDNGTLKGCKYISGTDQKIFKTAHEIHYNDHIRMQATFQENVDNAISKTINMPHDATVEDIKEAYLSAWRMKCKGITIYRDRSRDAQVLEVGHGDKKMVDISPTIEHATLTPQKRPNKLTGQTCKIETSCGTMYITINFDEETKPFEVFTMIGKAGGCASSQSEALGRLISLCLRAGIAPQHVVKQIRGITCHLPYGLGPKKVSSCPDAVAQALENILNLDKVENKTRPNGRGACPDCGSPLESGGGCATCTSCGYSDCG